jgi:hypothetical protein
MMGRVRRRGEPVGWNLRLFGRDQGRLVSTVGLPVGLDDTLLRGGPIGVGRGVLAMSAIRTTSGFWHARAGEPVHAQA